MSRREQERRRKQQEEERRHRGDKIGESTLNLTPMSPGCCCHGDADPVLDSDRDLNSEFPAKVHPGSRS